MVPHGTTFGSNPLATSVGCKSFELVNRPEFLKDVNVKADLFRKHYAELNAKYDCFKEVRGIGLMIGAELKDETLLKKITSECLNQGVFVLTAGHSVIRTVPALNITTDDINEGFARFDKALSVVFGK